MDAWIPWIMLPLVGAVIGYATNWLAIKMLFHPRNRKFGMQGLLPRRQADLARSVGEIVGRELVHLDSLLEPLHNVDLGAQFAPMIDDILEKKVADFKKIPLIGAMISPEMLAGLRDTIISKIDDNKPAIIAGLTSAAKEHIDIAAMTEERLSGFDLDTLERLVQKVASNEFKAIELWGAGLGLLIGLAQAGLLSVIG